ncbi:AT hook motif-containing protein [Trifolium pratense]|uniref:AT hook motif-containing protein n=2 Tax=Trifolium pratense TaxID=57577 RepID=A0A2K3PS21_TRIPR|nr:uncharacterized protein LOC123917157 isoform X2 [Trifolium pratense]PNY18085.1 AT hook motif-containing protein [Trifolium pratense]CAJ2639740.1 unnamed protein product [Trifolium pratense]
MDQQNQNNTPDGSGDVPMKRKRGRPRKYPRPDSEESSYMLLNQSRKQTPVRVEQAPVAPGFQAVNGNQHLQSSQESESNSNNAMVGQIVTGVIEAAFDAGFLLSVRVGNSDTILKGLVFKSGHFVPVSPENDVAPGVPMIQRNEVPFPSRPTQFQTPLPKEKNGQPASVSRIETLPMNGSQSAPQVPRGAVTSSNMAVASGNVPSVTSQTPDQLTRGNTVPVLFQPNFSNGMPVSTPPSQLTPVSLVSGVNIVGKEIPVGGNQVLPSPAQTISQNSFQSRMQSEGFPTNYQSSSDALNKTEDKSLPVASVPFEKQVTQDVKRIETPAGVMDTKTEISMAGDNIVANDTITMQEEKVNDLGQPVLSQSLHAVQSHVEGNSASAPTASNCTETGQMTELLQNNKTENQETKAAETGSSEDKLNDLGSFGTGLQHDGNVHSTNPF